MPAQRAPDSGEQGEEAEQYGETFLEPERVEKVESESTGLGRAESNVRVTGRHMNGGGSGCQGRGYAFRSS